MVGKNGANDEFLPDLISLLKGNKINYNSTLADEVHRHGTAGPEVLLEFLEQNQVAKWQFWHIALDWQNFKQWSPESRMAFLTAAWPQAFMTVGNSRESMFLLFSAVSASVFLSGIILGTSTGIFTTLMLTSMLYGLSRMLHHMFALAPSESDLEGIETAAAEGDVDVASASLF